MTHDTTTTYPTTLPRPLSAYKALLFDYGGVLVDLDAARSFAAFDALGMNVRPYIGLYGQRDFFGRIERGEQSVADFCEQLRVATGCMTATNDAIVAAWRAFTIGVPGERLAMLWRLKRTHRLLLLSNTSIIHWSDAEQHYLCGPQGDTKALFEHTFLSFEMGIEKPAPAIFETALQRAGVEANEVLFIDDSAENCAAARALGIDSLWAAPNGGWMAAFAPELPVAQVHRTLEKGLAQRIGASVATIGFFDGVHSGHHALLSEVVRVARAEQQASVAITFAQHPRCVVDPTFAPALLLSDEARIAALSTTGVDHVVVLAFDSTMARLTAAEFMQQVLCDKLGVRHLLIGHDHRFGRDRAEGFEEYITYGKAMGITVHQATRYAFGQHNPSSSLIRQLLREGKVPLANALLQSHYTLTGVVVEGRRVGRTIGFPTANVQLDDAHCLVPAKGVYLVRTNYGDGVMNIGHRPTFTDKPELRTIEVHLLDTTIDLYGKVLEVALLTYLRAEQRFDTIDALTAQIHSDCQTARELLAADGWRYVQEPPNTPLPPTVF